MGERLIMKFKNRTKNREDWAPDTDRKIDEDRYRDSPRRRGQNDKRRREIDAYAESESFYRK